MSRPPDPPPRHAPGFRHPCAAPGGARFGVVVPVKRLVLAKSRLAVLGDDARRELAVAFAVDTVLAARDCPLVEEVLVVTGEPGLVRRMARFGVAAVADGEEGGLNAALRHGAAELVRRRPRVRPVALCGDLPALRAEELGAVLGRAPERSPAFVADATGTGTTLYTAPDLAGFRPAFGAGSRDSHRRAGAVEIDARAAASVRRDVDLPDDLGAAVALGLGERSAQVVRRRRLGP